MLTRDEKYLQIFESFMVDYSLPKYTQENISEVLVSDVDFSRPNISGRVISGFTINNLTIESGTDSSVFLNQNLKNKNIFEKISKFFKKNPTKENIKEKIKPTITIQQFFENVKKNLTNLEVYDKSVEEYQLVLNNAKKMGQTSLVETLYDNMELIKFESMLCSIGKTVVITEEQIVDFYKKCEKGLRLDWIANFIRLIPSNIISIKTKLDDYKIFDNYVILHYDPTGKSYQMTKEEIAKKKDPILFGVIKGSTKLYYIGDWIDEYCDLTLDKLVDFFGKDVVDNNNLSVNTIYKNLK